MYIGADWMLAAAYACTLVKWHVCRHIYFYSGADWMLPDALVCFLVEIACLKARLLVHCCRLDVASCVGMYSCEDSMFEGTFICTLMQIG